MKAEGYSDREISLCTDIPVNTIRTWRNRRIPDYARPSIPAMGKTLHQLQRFNRCEVPADAYAYLLGMYLGDGCLTRNGTSWSLRVTLDDHYPGIITECCDAIESVSGRKPIPTPDRHGVRCVVVQSTWRPWIVLFPQHAPGRKHLRRIRLEDWQQQIVDAAPGPFLRGLIQTDGWRGLNRVHVKGRDYAYPRYQFSNRSDDIRKLFTDACEKLGIRWRQWTRYHVSVADRDSVALLDTFVGPKT